MRNPRQEFIEWTKGSFYSLFRKDRASAIAKATEKAKDVAPEERGQLLQTLQTTAGKQQKIAKFWRSGWTYIVYGLLMSTVAAHVPGGWTTAWAVAVAVVLLTLFVYTSTARKALATNQLIAALV